MTTSLSDKIYLGQAVKSLTTAPQFQPWSRVTIWVDDEHCLTAGDDTGREMELDCPWGTQQMANDLLASLKAVRYTPYEAAGAQLDPAAELGDGVTVDGVYGYLTALDADADVMFAPDISAPGEEEIDHEYPYLSPQQRQMQRNMATTRALIKKTSDAIALQIEGLDGEVTALTVTLDGVTITDSSGTTKIKGSSIETASIAANAIRADQVNLTGAITWSDLSAAAQQRVDSGKGDDNPSYIESSFIDRAKILAPDIYGGMFYATGKGASGGAAYYIYDGASINYTTGAVTLGTKIGYLSYDTNGNGTEEATNRVFLTTLNGTALKLNASGDMSLEADTQIYVHTPFTLGTDLYGTELPSPTSRPIGSLFFLKA